VLATENQIANGDCLLLSHFIFELILRLMYSINEVEYWWLIPSLRWTLLGSHDQHSTRRKGKSCIKHLFSSRQQLTSSKAPC
jgi:hypothetical protein